MDRHIIRASLEAAALADMRWGLDDCCLWVADIIVRHGGPDIAAPFRGYCSRLGAARALRRYGGAGLLEACQKRAAELAAARARKPWRDGDVGLVNNPAGHLMAIFCHGRWAARTATGLAWLPQHMAIAAWRFPCLQQ